MSDRLNKETASLEALSALADGEASETESELAFTAWRENPEARARWHEYQVTGDLMRSETLAATATTDADFLAKLRPRLAQEPAVLAPVARPAVQGEVILPYAVPVRHRRWSGPMAVAAGFVMVLGTVVHLAGGDLFRAPQMDQTLALGDSGAPSQTGLGQGWAGQEAALSPVLQTGLVADTPLSTSAQANTPHAGSFSQNAAEGVAMRSGRLLVIRDAQLDQILATRRAEQDGRPFSAPTGPSVRKVGFEADQR